MKALDSEAKTLRAPGFRGDAARLAPRGHEFGALRAEAPRHAELLAGSKATLGNPRTSHTKGPSELKASTSGVFARAGAMRAIRNITLIALGSVLIGLGALVGFTSNPVAGIALAAAGFYLWKQTKWGSVYGYW